MFIAHSPCIRGDILGRRAGACLLFFLHTLVIPSLEPIHIAQGLSGVAFAGYGLHCLLGERMKLEFERYGLSRWRSLTGWLQLAGSLGLLLAFLYPPLLLPSAAGLALMMFCGTVVRLAIRDPFRAAIPAFALLLLNLWIAVAAFR